MPYFCLTAADGKLSKVHIPSSARAGPIAASVAATVKNNLARMRSFVRWRGRNSPSAAAMGFGSEFRDMSCDFKGAAAASQWAAFYGGGDASGAISWPMAIIASSLSPVLYITSRLIRGEKSSPAIVKSMRQMTPQSSFWVTTGTPSCHSKYPADLGWLRNFAPYSFASAMKPGTQEPATRISTATE